MKELHRLSATAAATALAKREITAEALASALLDRVAARESVVRAWAHLEPDRVLAAARALDAGPMRGLLHGLPVGIKDIIDTADQPTGYGSAIYAGHRPAWDAACVGAIHAAGGIVMGKTVTSELATSYRGKTANPHDPAHTPGGSSSGSAAAVADCMLPFALGTQTGGSTVRPSSFCGVVGYKPSFGLVNRQGVKPVSESLDTVGIIARTVPDAALLAAGITGREALARVEHDPPTRIGVWRTFEWAQAAPETVAALDEAARRLAQAGVAVEPVEMGAAFATLSADHKATQGFEMARALGHELRHHRVRLSASLVQGIEEGMCVSPDEYDTSRMRVIRLRALIDAVFDRYDVLLAPSAPGEAPRGLEETGSPVFNRGWTLLGVPCVTVPAFTGPHALPVGVQVVGRYWRDAAMLGRARWIHRTLGDWRGGET